MLVPGATKTREWLLAGANHNTYSVPVTIRAGHAVRVEQVEQTPRQQVVLNPERGAELAAGDSPVGVSVDFLELALELSQRSQLAPSSGRSGEGQTSAAGARPSLRSGARTSPHS